MQIFILLLVAPNSEPSAVPSSVHSEPSAVPSSVPSAIPSMKPSFELCTSSISEPSELLILSITVTSLISSLIPSTPTLLHSLSSSVSSFEPSYLSCEVSRHTMISSFTPRSLSSSALCLYPIILCHSLSPSPILKHGYDQSSVTSFIPSAVPFVDPSTVPGLKPSLILTDTNAEPSYVSILRNFLCPNRRLSVGADIFILLYVVPFYGDNGELNIIFPSMHQYVLYIEGLLSTSSQTSPKLSAPGLGVVIDFILTL
jgi:hypothetical protein